MQAGKIVGAVGVIGPTRLNYGRIVPIVDYTAQLVGRMVCGPQQGLARRDMAKERNTDDLDDAFLDDIEAILDEDEEIGEEEIGAEKIEADETSEIKAEVAELKDRLLRALADAENTGSGPSATAATPRSTARRGSRATCCRCTTVSSGRSTARPTAARAAAPGLLEGIELTQRALLARVREGRASCSSAPQAGRPLRSEPAPGMFEAPVPGPRPATSSRCWDEGFTIGERLLRPAQVGVSSGCPARRTAVGPAPPQRSGPPKRAKADREPSAGFDRTGPA